MRPRSTVERRLNFRVPTPQGLLVSWNSGDRKVDAFAEDFSISGAFIASQHTLPVGTRLTLLLSLPEGKIHVQAIVRNLRPKRGMGVEFVSMGGKEFDLVLTAFKRLNPASPQRSSHERSKASGQ